MIWRLHRGPGLPSTSSTTPGLNAFAYPSVWLGYDKKLMENATCTAHVLELPSQHPVPLLCAWEGASRDKMDSGIKSSPLEASELELRHASAARKCALTFRLAIVMHVVIDLALQLAHRVLGMACGRHLFSLGSPFSEIPRVVRLFAPRNLPGRSS